MTAFAIRRPDTAFADTRRAKEVQEIRDPRHLAWIASLPSVISGAFGCEAAHVNFPDKRFGKHMRGKGTKAGDNWTLPLLPDEHRTGPNAQHKTGHEQAWWEAHGIDANTLADRLWRVSGDTEAAIKIILEARKP
ncbi:hypothetical protein QTA58_22885 [Neorhizobium sp. CSC1952]|uniref:hypothetical protein n=1 Tax=Neorhizobium sp. CSC1952 TaxID=2978974 RepID=UPI0025A5D888|nr:hypothetical protein [Rhizobium sp. CSC1952]WJR66999.1 hypothetical protein QTA58_22885 [Rhizobium sp. CSC1952]